LFIDTGIEITVAKFIKILIATVFFSVLSYCVALPTLFFSSKTSTVVAVANILNIYAIITSDAFFPVNILPDWVKPLIFTSPFYYLTTSIRISFQNEIMLYTLLIIFSAAASFLLLLIFSGNRIFAK
jgi:ABC-2 type transport system permease protein